mgnify:CR=1 FL=1
MEEIKYHIEKYGYSIVKARYGVQILKEHNLLSDLDKALDKVGKLN